MFRTINAVIAPSLVADLRLDASRLGFLTSAYFLTFAAAKLPLGVALDRYPRFQEPSTRPSSTVIGSPLLDHG
jgi:MFS family permease